MQKRSIDQYKLEERSIVAKRMLSFDDRIAELIACAKEDFISTDEKIDLLKNQIFEMTKDVKFKKSSGMGEILEAAFDFIKRNYEDVLSR